MLPNSDKDVTRPIIAAAIVPRVDLAVPANVLKPIQLIGYELGKVARLIKDSFSLDPNVAGKAKSTLGTIAAAIIGLVVSFSLFGGIAKAILSESPIGKFLKELLFGTKTIKGFGAASGLLSKLVVGPFGLVVGIIKKVIGVFGIFGKMSLGKMVSNVFDSIFGVLDKMMYQGLTFKKVIYSAIIRPLQVFANVNISSVLRWLSSIPKLLAGLGGSGAGGILTIIKTLITFAGKISLIGIIITAVIAIFTGFFKFIIDNFDYVKKQVAAFVTNLLAGMGGVEGLKARFTGIFESLKKIFGFFAAIGYAIASEFFAKKIGLMHGA
jgi:hypothetical protein